MAAWSSSGIARRERNMPTGEKTARPCASSFRYAPRPTSSQRAWREAILLASYHLRLLNWWLLLLVALGFLGSSFLVWLPVHAGGAEAQGQATALSQFVLEPGAGLLAGMLASSLIANGPLLDVTMATRTGIA